MRKLILSLVFIAPFLNQNMHAQNDQNRVITTGVPFLLIAADARAAGMGDQGVATAPDAFSQQWNPAKYAFIERAQGIGVTYTPYLSKLVNDIFLGQVVYHNRIDDRSAFAASLRYFNLGDIEAILNQNPSQAELENPLLFPDAAPSLAKINPYD